ncbi:copper transporter [Kroppenstedtia eburnea]|uniref:copper transporter n=1 Tax=Kroppenstedtia eburnea TaxID=714067 RepID=UPI003624C261
MISSRTLLHTLIAVFLSLGVGILLGGTGGHSWLEQREGVLLDNLEQRMDQLSQEQDRLRKDLQGREENLERLRGQNRILLREAVKGRLKDRLVLVFGGSDREARRLGEAIQAAGGAIARPSAFPSLPDRFDAIVLLPDSAENPQMIRDVRMSYSGPVLIQRRGEETSRPVFGMDEDRSFSLPGPYTGESLQTFEWIQLIQDATNRGKEASS